eukprot:COSAG04_NODE_265_length_18593_cov_4.226776_16_plen_213_part_00
MGLSAALTLCPTPLSHRCFSPVSPPNFAHFPPFFARSLRLGARKPDSAKGRRKTGAKRPRNSGLSGVGIPLLELRIGRVRRVGDADDGRVPRLAAPAPAAATVLGRLQGWGIRMYGSYTPVSTPFLALFPPFFRRFSALPGFLAPRRRERAKDGGKWAENGRNRGAAAPQIIRIPHPWPSPAAPEALRASAPAPAPPRRWACKRPCCRSPTG